MTWPKDLDVHIYKHTKGLNDSEDIGYQKNFYSAPHYLWLSSQLTLCKSLITACFSSVLQISLKKPQHKQKQQQKIHFFSQDLEKISLHLWEHMGLYATNWI